MIDKYIKLLLKDNKRVIIPDFGGFVVKRTASGDAISFNGFLKFNDDLLVTAVAQGEKCSKEDAMKSIVKNVEQIGLTLTEAGAYELKGVGFLVRDKKGNVRFMSELTSEAQNDDSQLKKDEKMSDVAPVVDTKTEPTAETPPLAKSSTAARESTLTGVNIWFKHRLFIPAVVLLVVVIVVLIWLIGKPEQVDSIKQSHEDMVSEMADKKMEGDDTKPKKRFADFFKRDKSEQDVVVTQDEKVVSIPPVMQPLSKDVARGITLHADRDIAPKGKERYNVIIGSFQDLENAKELQALLINDGYGAQIFDRYNGWQAVSLGGFPSLDIALRVSGENINEYPDLWILVK